MKEITNDTIRNQRVNSKSLYGADVIVKKCRESVISSQVTGSGEVCGVLIGHV